VDVAFDDAGVLARENVEWEELEAMMILLVVDE